MQVHRDISSLPEFRKAVVTIGTFDGVHLGHQQIIRQLKAEAAVIGGETVIITFHPHPRKVVKSEGELRLLNTLEEKSLLLGSHGIDHLVIVPFTGAFAALSPEDYVREFLVARFRPAVLIIGYDHRFGKDRAGDYTLLERLAPTLGFRVIEIPEHVLHTVRISSTHIRNDLRKGDLREANNSLGYAYPLSGMVVEGDRRGRTLGFPTANLQPMDPEKLIPADGVYAVTLMISGRSHAYRGMLNIGYRPTVDGKKRTIEVHIFNFTDTIYGETVSMKLHFYLRTERTFGSLEELRAQLAADQLNATQALTHI